VRADADEDHDVGLDRIDQPIGDAFDAQIVGANVGEVAFLGPARGVWILQDRRNVLGSDGVQQGDVVAGELEEVARRGGKELIAVRHLRSPCAGRLALLGQSEQLRDEAGTIHPRPAFRQARGDQRILIRPAQHRDQVRIAIEFK